MKEEDIQKSAQEYADKSYRMNIVDWHDYISLNSAVRIAYIAGANYALKNQWISVDDELPEDLEDVIVMSGNCGHGVDIGYYDKRFNAFFRTLSGDERIPATHWMPIPEFPIKWNKDGK